jgi:hypothetical protein
MTKQRDQAKKEWMKSWVNVEVSDLMRRDRDDIKNMIELQSDDINKLRKVIEKFAEL